MDLVRVEVIHTNEKEQNENKEFTHHIPRIVTLDYFQIVLDQISEFTHHIVLFGSGDPLLHPQFNDLMDICYKQRMKVHLITDGIHMKDQICLLYYPQIYELTFDLRNIDQEKINYKDHIDAVLNLCETASGLNYPRCSILFNKTDVKKKPATCFMLSRVGKRGIPEYVSDRDGFQIMKNVYVRLEEDKRDNGVPVDHGHCRNYSAMITILANGIVTPCGQDDEGNISLGNINITPLKTILQSGRRTKMIKEFEKGKIREQYCRKCQYREKYDQE